MLLNILTHIVKRSKLRNLGKSLPGNKLSSRQIIKIQSNNDHSQVGHESYKTIGRNRDTLLGILFIDDILLKRCSDASN